jgi:hypothetical protein
VTAQTTPSGFYIQPCVRGSCSCALQGATTAARASILVSETRDPGKRHIDIYALGRCLGITSALQCLGHKQGSSLLSRSGQVSLTQQTFKGLVAPDNSMPKAEATTPRYWKGSRRAFAVLRSVVSNPSVNRS